MSISTDDKANVIDIKTKKGKHKKNGEDPNKNNGADQPPFNTAQEDAPNKDVAPEASEEYIALVFAHEHTNELRYVAKWGQWFIWDGTCWRMDEKRKVFSMARNLCRLVGNAFAGSDKEKRGIASAKTRAAVISLAGEAEQLVASIEQWDADPWLLNTPDGVVDLRNGKLRAHQITDYMTKQTAVSPGGDCPLWLKFLGEITAGNVELQSYLQRVSGYCLTGITREQELFFNYGEGNNGKGVFTGAISGILDDYHQSTPIETFTVAKSERHPTELAGLGRRAVCHCQ